MTGARRNSRSVQHVPVREIFGEPEDSNFTDDGEDYDLNGLLSATVGSPPVSFPVKDLKWVIRWDPQAHDKKRLAGADLAAPILIHKAGNRWVTLDGIHRLVKAVALGVPELPAIMVSDELLSHYKIGNSSC